VWVVVTRSGRRPKTAVLDYADGRPPATINCPEFMFMGKRLSRPLMDPRKQKKT
jgi:hypothetical protein